MKLRDPAVRDDTPWSQCLARDLVGTIIAKRLGIPVPDYALVMFDDVFVRSHHRHNDKDRICSNKGVNFGSNYLKSVDEGVLGSSSDWAPIMVLDALGFNADRFVSNANVLWDGTRLLAIDHGMLAPTWTFHHDGTDSKSLYGYVNIRTHAGFSVLKGSREEYDLADAWGSLITADFLTWLRSIVPRTWCTGQELDLLFEFLASRYTVALKQRDELKGVIC